MITFTILMVLGAYLLAAVLVTWVVLTRQKNRKAKWLAGFFSIEGPGRHCENQDFISEYLEMIRKVFVPDSSQNQEKTKTP